MLKNISEKLKYRNGKFHDENQYLNLIENVINEGEIVEGRNGKTICGFGAAMTFDLSNGSIPFLTTKQLAWKTCAKELFWFIKGSTDNEELKKQNVKIWDGNSSREFLDSIGLHHREENDLGPVYGFQWRHFNADYKTCKDNYDNQGIDQIKYIIDCLKDEKLKYSRRLILDSEKVKQIQT